MMADEIRQATPIETQPATPVSQPAAGPPAAALPEKDDAVTGEPSPTDADEDADEHKGWAPPRRNWAKTALFALLVVAGALAALYAWSLPPFRSSLVSTDNAFVRGQVTVISPQVGGYVTEIMVTDFEQVDRGDPLVKIDDRIFRQRVSQARANIAGQETTLANSEQSARSGNAQVALQNAAVDAARANLARAQADMRRVDELVRQGSVSEREQDQTRAALAQAQASLRQAEAQRTIALQQVRSVQVGKGGLEAGVSNAQAELELARINLDNTIIRAPRAGQLGEVGVQVGQSVSPGTQLMFLVPQELWIIANFRESDIGGIRTGQKATVRIDALGDMTLAGVVSQISPATGSEFSIVRPDSASGNFVKVAQRVPVQIRLTKGQAALSRLRPGLSAEVSIDTGQ